MDSQITMGATTVIAITAKVPTSPKAVILEELLGMNGKTGSKNSLNAYCRRKNMPKAVE
ncbi:hypothetical protein GCM10007981_05500 [Thermocladium modestius]|uniref:Uncharacterized protein n=1 Tax=Thermocladium modestius TaxID=62609 RepID=A0A830GSY7_9CREN|nr:hypothetical protein GCM10007981_05500 [Thermocladium modestius]